MESLEARAARYANEQHAAVGQRRKYTNEPYIVHPAAVAEIVKTVPHTEAMVAAAWLHDTVEDTDATIADIEAEFGNEVAELVAWLTAVSQPEDGNRKARKAIDRKHTAEAPPAAKTIKLADVIHNSASIMEHDPNFARVYLEEKRLLLEVLSEGDPELYRQAEAILSGYDRSRLDKALS